MPCTVADDQVMLVECCGAAVVAEFTQADEVVGEAGYDVSGARSRG